VPCSLWSATLSCDDQTAVDAGNVILGKNLRGKNADFFRNSLVTLYRAPLVGGKNRDFRAKKFIFYRKFFCTAGCRAMAFAQFGYQKNNAADR
jgi:hypothetical protein